MLRDFLNNFISKISLKFAAYTAATNGQNVIDLKGFNGARVEITSGTITDGTSYEFEVKEGNESDLSDGAAVADEDLLGTEPTFVAADDDKVKALSYIGKKRYIRIDLKTVTGSPSTGGVFGGKVLLGLPRHAPVTQS